MQKHELALLVSTALGLIFVNSPAQAANADALSGQNVLIGATPSVQASANNGKGILFGLIDSGTTGSWIGFQGWGSPSQGRISGVVCVITCTPGHSNSDDLGHGTFITSELIGGIPSKGLVGVAPAANVLAVKVLNSSNYVTTATLSTGIRDAVDHGAQVLNLSIAPSGSVSSQLAFWDNIAGAVNYAASKGAVIVFAGGNNSQAFTAGGAITGFSDQALSHMLIVGSTNSKKQLSSFSDTPGTAHFVTTSGKSVSYQSLWVVADGENLTGASNSSSYSGLAVYTGTSMAAPQAAGAAALLASKWPFLLSQGTIPQIIEQSAQDLGSSGQDSAYGRGFLRVDLAMQPIGGQSVPVASGASVSVGSAGGGAVASGAAFGSMQDVNASLARAVSYDSFMRGFPLFNGPAVITSASLSPDSIASQLVSGQSGASARQVTQINDRDWLAFSGAPETIQSGPFKDDRMGFTLDPAQAAPLDWSYGLMRDSTYVGIGRGADAQLSFSDARWGGDSAFFNTDVSAGSALMSTVPHAQFATVGMPLGKQSRFAASIISESAETYGNVRGLSSSAFGASLAYTTHPASNWMISLTTSLLSENNLLLGSRAYSNVLGVTPAPLSVSVGLGTNIKLGHGFQLGFDAAYVTTDGGENAVSLISKTSRISSDSFNLALAKTNLTGAGDALRITVSQPLRVFAGTSTLTVPTGTDDNARPIIETDRVSLTPSGHEIDYSIGYARPLLPGLKASFNLMARHDADNVRGAMDAAAFTRLTLTF